MPHLHCLNVVSKTPCKPLQIPSATTNTATNTKLRAEAFEEQTQNTPIKFCVSSSCYLQLFLVNCSSFSPGLGEFLSKACFCTFHFGNHLPLASCIRISRFRINTLSMSLQLSIDFKVVFTYRSEFHVTEIQP